MIVTNKYPLTIIGTSIKDKLVVVIKDLDDHRIYMIFPLFVVEDKIRWYYRDIPQYVVSKKHTYELSLDPDDLSKVIYRDVNTGRRKIVERPIVIEYKSITIEPETIKVEVLKVLLKRYRKKKLTGKIPIMAYDEPRRMVDITVISPASVDIFKDTYLVDGTMILIEGLISDSLGNTHLVYVPSGIFAP